MTSQAIFMPGFTQGLQLMDVADDARVTLILIISRVTQTDLKCQRSAAALVVAACGDGRDFMPATEHERSPPGNVPSFVAEEFPFVTTAGVLVLPRDDD